MALVPGLRRVLLPAALAALGALCASEARAERIVLKNGHEIKECWILEENKAEIVIAVIRGGNIGKITLDPSHVEAIDRTRETTIEEALAKARKALEEEARRRELERAAAAAAATATAKPAAGPKTGGSAGAGAPSVTPGSKLAALVGPTTPEEEDKINAAINGIGDTRNQGGAAGRRANALKDLIAVGPKAIGSITKALSDDVSYRRMNAALAVAEIAKADGRLGIYEETVPALIKNLYDQSPWVRVAANKALEAVSSQSMGFPPDAKGEDLAPEEVAAIDKWGKWWDTQKIILGVK